MSFKNETEKEAGGTYSTASEKDEKDEKDGEDGEARGGATARGIGRIMGNKIAPGAHDDPSS